MGDFKAINCDRLSSMGKVGGGERQYGPCQQPIKNIGRSTGSDRLSAREGTWAVTCLMSYVHTSPGRL